MRGAVALYAVEGCAIFHPLFHPAFSHGDAGPICAMRPVWDTTSRGGSELHARTNSPGHQAVDLSAVQESQPLVTGSMRGLRSGPGAAATLAAKSAAAPSLGQRSRTSRESEDSASPAAARLTLQNPRLFRVAAGAFRCWFHRLARLPICQVRATATCADREERVLRRNFPPRTKRPAGVRQFRGSSAAGPEDGGRDVGCPEAAVYPVQ